MQGWRRWRSLIKCPKKTKKTRRGMPGVKKGINKFNEGYSNRQWVKLAGYNFWQLILSVICR